MSHKTLEDIKQKLWKQLGFKSEKEYVEHLTKMERKAKDRGFTPYAEYDKTGIGLAYGRCSCIMAEEKHYIAKTLEESIENIKKEIKRTKERIKLDQLEHDKMNIEAIRARVDYTPECK